MSKKKIIDYLTIIVIALLITWIVLKIIPSLNKYITFIIALIAMYFVYTKTDVGNQISKLTQ